MTTRVALSADEVRRCIRIALERSTRNRAAGVVDRQNSRRAGADIIVDGMLGELALYRLLDQDTAPLEDTTPRSAATDRDQDLRLPSGETIDIKTTFRDGADMQVPAHKAAHPADIYGLMIRESPSHTPRDGETAVLSCRGFATAEQVFDRRNLRRIPYRLNMPFYVVPQSSLRVLLVDGIRQLAEGIVHGAPGLGGERQVCRDDAQAENRGD